MPDLARIIGQNIRERRQASGLSQQEFAKKARIERSHLTRLELGEGGGPRGVGLALLVKVARALGCEVCSLLKAPSKAA